MKNEKDYARDFIDLAKLGRTDWRSLALTILIFGCLSAIGTFCALLLPIPGMHAYRSLYLHHFSFNLATLNLLSDAGGPVGILGFWLVCKYVLRRPFCSLISIDLKFSVKRFLLGAVLYLAAYVVSVAIMWIYAGVRFDAWTSPIGSFSPHIDLNVNPFLMAPSGLVLLLGVSFLAFGEELYMRGWLTQTLGQYIRIPAVVVVLIAVLFALLHTQYKWPVKTVMFFDSVGFSFLSLRDRRLELSVGAHSMTNIWAWSIPIIFTGQSSNIPISIADAIVFALAKSALPLSLMYLFLQKTNSWFKSTGKHA